MEVQGDSVGLSRSLERLMADLDPAMLIVTVASGGQRAGCLVGFSSQCSIHPFRYWVALSIRNHTFDVASRADTLGVHVPARDQHALAALFGEDCGHERDKFASVAWHPWRDGTPILDDCPGWFVGRILERSMLGDHVGVVLEPLDAGYRGPLSRLALSDVTDLEPGHPA